MNGHTRSCGCQRGNRYNHTVKHGHNRTGRKSDPRPPSSTYKIWQGMKDRCLNPKNRNYSYYGGRGITVCERWKVSFESFLKDMGKCPDGMSIDRKDVNGNYEPLNCRWATDEEQAQNMRTTRLKPHQVLQIRWLRECGLSYGDLGKIFNVSPHTARNVATGITWANIKAT